MIQSAISSLITAVIIYWYPSYATYKVISRPSGTEGDTEKWLIYWCVVGALAAFEASLEWLVNWVVFYYQIKVLLLVFIARGGAGVIYHEFLSRHYAQHEPEIDRHIEEIKSRAFAYAQERLQDLYKVVLRAVTALREGQGLGQKDRAPQSGSNPSSYGEVASQLWNTYGSAALAAGTKMFGSGGAAATSASSSSSSVVSNGGPSSSPRPFGHSTGVGPPVDGKKLVPPTFIPLPNSPPGNERNGGRSPSPSPSSRS